MSSPLEAAVAYTRRGLRVVPVPFRQKGPTLDAWQTLRLDEAVLARYFNGEAMNLGVLTGEPSGGLVDVDLDSDEAVRLAPAFLPKTPLWSGRERRPGSHAWYIAAPIPETEKFKDPLAKAANQKGSLVELRSTGCQTLVSPSVHPDGDAYRWTGEPPAAQVRAPTLRTAVRRLAAGALLARRWPAEGSRHDAALALGGLLVRGGWAPGEASEFVRVVAEAAGDEEARARAVDVETTAKRLRTGGATTGGPTLAALVGEPVVAKVREWLGLTVGSTRWLIRPPGAPETAPWPDPESIPDGLPAVPAFEGDLLPEALAHWVEDIAERAQCPVEFVAVGAVVALASLVGRALAIRPKQHDDWTVVPNLWGLVIGRPGIMKSPALEEALRPLKRLAAEAGGAHAERVRAHAFDVATAKARRALVEKRLKATVDEGGDPAMHRAEYDALEPAPPTERRYLVNDATVEKIGELLNQNPRGFLLYRDELAGFLRTMDREGHENDRAFYCEAWSGTGSYVYDRIGRGTLKVDAACVSILGGMQPGPLVAYLQEVFGDGASDDGLIQRFQLMVWPDVSPSWHNVDRWPDTPVKTRAFEVYRRLAHLDPAALNARRDPESPDALPYVRFRPQAQEMFDAWRASLETRLRDESEHPVLVSHLAKFRSLMPSLALLFHLADVVLTPGDDVGGASAAQATWWCDLLEAHARRVYHAIVAQAETATRELAVRLRAGALPSPFRARAVVRHGWSGLTTAEAVQGALDWLSDLGWVRCEAVPTSSRGGRPTEEYLINPKVLAVSAPLQGMREAAQGAGS